MLRPFIFTLYCSFLFVISGCQSPTPTETKPVAMPAPAATPAAASGHEHSAPHGGALIELGEEFAHLEFVLDAATGQLTAYALDGEAEKPVRLKQAEIELTLTQPVLTVKLAGVANALTGETASDTSEFSATVAQLKGASGFKGTLNAVTIKGRAFKGVAFSYPQGSETH